VVALASSVNALRINSRGSAACNSVHHPDFQGKNVADNEIKTLAKRIVDHGCESCGSVPVFFDKGDNDVKSQGELTFNYVDRSPK
jgi:hypothetical protein